MDGGEVADNGNGAVRPSDADTREEPLPSPPAAAPERKRSPRPWKRRTFNVVVAGLVIAAACFIVCSIYELVTLHGQLANATPDAWARMQDATTSAPPELRARVLLETLVIHERYHQANSLLLSRAWTSQLAFLVGTILALVGATFVLGRFRDEATQLNADGIFGKFGLSATSPGLVLAVLGVLVMLGSMASNRVIDVADAPLYVLSTGTPAAIEPPARFPSASAREALDETTAELQRRVADSEAGAPRPDAGK